MDIVQFDYLNSIFAPLAERARELYGQLRTAGISAEWGWYANYSVMLEGEWRTQRFPTPEVEAEGGCHRGGCDIGFRMDEVFVEFRLSRERALSFDFKQLPQPFEVYGVEDFLRDFYREGMDLDGIARRIEAGTETAVNVGMTLPADTECAVLLPLVKDCCQWAAR